MLLQCARGNFSNANSDQKTSLPTEPQSLRLLTVGEMQSRENRFRPVWDEKDHTGKRTITWPE